MPEVNISSAMVREELNKLSDAPGMLDRETARLIALQGLYQTPYAVMMKPYVSCGGATRIPLGFVIWRLSWPMSMVSRCRPRPRPLCCTIAAEMKLGMMQAMADHYQLCEYPGEMESNALLHGKIAAVFAARAMCTTRMLNAIRYRHNRQAACRRWNYVFLWLIKPKRDESLIRVWMRSAL